MKIKVLGASVRDKDMNSFSVQGPVAGLNPGVGRARILFRPVRRPAYAGVEVHVVGGFQPVGLRAVVGRGRVGDDVLQVRLLVPVGVFQVHSVCIVVSSALLLRIIQRLRGKERVIPIRLNLECDVFAKTVPGGTDSVIILLRLFGNC